MAINDYYVILGVPRTAGLRSIRAAYRDLARQRHPDVVGPAGDEAFREINEAYEVLSDPAKRRAHDLALRRVEPDARRERGARLDSPPPIPRPIAHAIPRDRDSMRPWFTALRLLRGLGSPPRPARTEGLELEVVLSPSEALRGGELPVGVPLARTCPGCGGTGREQARPCLRCGGWGRVEEREVVRVPIPARVQHGTVIDVALDPLGRRTLFLRLHVSVE